MYHSRYSSYSMSYSKKRIETPFNPNFKITNPMPRTDVRGKKFWIGTGTAADNTRTYRAYNLPDDTKLNDEFTAIKWSEMQDQSVFVTEATRTLVAHVNDVPVPVVHQEAPAALPAPTSAKKTFVYDIPLKDLRYGNNSVSVPTPTRTLYIYQRQMPELKMNKILDKIRKAFTGNLHIEGEEDTSRWYQRAVITKVVVEDETMKRLANLIATYQINLELKRMIRAAKRTKSFFQKAALKLQLMTKHGGDEKLVDELVEKRFNRDKYDYQCFEALKSCCNDENIYLTVDSIVFVMTDEVGRKWAIVESPGKIAATYIMSDALPLPELLGALITTPKCVIIADEDIQRKIGFVTRLVHKGFETWRKQLNAIAEDHGIRLGLAFNDVVKVATEIKKANKR